MARYEGRKRAASADRREPVDDRQNREQRSWEALREGREEIRDDEAATSATTYPPSLVSLNGHDTPNLAWPAGVTAAR